ncbi:MAG: hypothetical protein MJ252_10400 [archaeon]|nr:hypothetical protein [archaeon]
MNFLIPSISTFNKSTSLTILVVSKASKTTLSTCPSVNKCIPVSTVTFNLRSKEGSSKGSSLQAKKN